MPEYWCYKPARKYMLDHIHHSGRLLTRESWGCFVQHLYRFSGTTVTVMESLDLIIVNTTDYYLEGNDDLDCLLEHLEREFVIIEKW